jgi:hypothetical protein
MRCTPKRVPPNARRPGYSRRQRGANPPVMAQRGSRQHTSHRRQHLLRYQLKRPEPPDNGRHQVHWSIQQVQERGDQQCEALGELLGGDAGAADEAEQLVSGHGVLVVAQALDQLHRRDDSASRDLILVARHRASPDSPLGLADFLGLWPVRLTLCICVVMGRLGGLSARVHQPWVGFGEDLPPLPRWNQRHAGRAGRPRPIAA